MLGPPDIESRIGLTGGNIFQGEVTPDQMWEGRLAPRTPVPGFYLCCGFVGHGFMMAPVVAKHYALHLTGGPTHPFFHKWRLARFAEGDTETEHWNIG